MAYASSGDLEAVADMLRGDNTSTVLPHVGHFDVIPPEKERKRMVLVISCVGLTMTFLAAVMVGITLGLSHMMDDPSKQIFE
jgi:hypothetical protein